MTKLRVLKLSAGGRMSVAENEYLSQRYDLIGFDSYWREDLAQYVSTAVLVNPYGGSAQHDFENLQKIIAAKADIILPSIDADAEFLACYKELIEFECGALVVVSPLGSIKLADKKVLSEELVKAGLSDFAVPETTDYPCVVKNRKGQGSAGMYVATKPDDLIRQGFSPERQIRQEYYHPSDTVSVECIFDLDGNLQVVIPFVVLERENWRNQRFGYKPGGPVEALVRHIFARLRVQGYEFQGPLNLDFVFSGTDTIKLVDLNIRRGALLQAAINEGLNYYDYLEDCLEGTPLPLLFRAEAFSYDYAPVEEVAK